jgi:ATP-dependent Clp protease ATP-binding subunit ClpE
MNDFQNQNQNEMCQSCHTHTATALVNLNGQEFPLCGSCFEKINRDPKEIFRLFGADAIMNMKQTLGNQNKKPEKDILVDLTAKTFEPVLFREKELNRMSQILLRKTKNNPILIGEAGTGKTAIAEHFAMMVKNKEIPRFNDHKVYSVSVGSIMANTKYRGDLEEKIETIINRVTNEKCILFIDEIHLLMGTGGDNDVNIANLLKPHLARGEMKLIGATTLSEYRRIEKDKAFSRRLQPVKVSELSAEQTLTILEKVSPSYQKFHSVKMDNSTLSHIVKLADKYLKDRSFPDKAIDILDEVMAHSSLVNKEKFSTEQKNEMKVSFKSLLTAGGMNEKEISDVMFTMDKIENSKVKSITINDINKVVEIMTNIPLSSLEKADKEKLRNFSTTLQEQVIGQTEATDALARTVKRSRLKLTNKNKPTVLFFAGPTGVGKTEAAKVLTTSLFGNEDAMVRFDMSEFMEKHSISKLVGSPPGYIGHDEEGELTEKIRRNPFSVILLDEYEKAHPAVSNLFLQVFDDGRLTDTKGRVVDFSNTIIIMTSNIGTVEVKTLGFGSTVPAVANDHTLASLKKMYRPEFLNRIDEIITFKELTENDLLKIVDLQINQLKESLAEQNINIELNQEAKELLVKKGHQPSLGARPLKRVITREVEDLLVDYVLEQDNLSVINIQVKDDKLVIL